VRPDRFGCEFEFIVETSQDQIVQEKLLEQFDNRFLVDLKNHLLVLIRCKQKYTINLSHP